MRLIVGEAPGASSSYSTLRRSCGTAIVSRPSHPSPAPHRGLSNSSSADDSDEVIWPSTVASSDRACRVRLRASRLHSCGARFRASSRPFDRSTTAPSPDERGTHRSSALVMMRLDPQMRSLELVAAPRIQLCRSRRSTRDAVADQARTARCSGGRPAGPARDDLTSASSA